MSMQLADLRKQLMSDRKVLCTGNPNTPSNLAFGIKKIFPNTTFVHKSNGWDLTDPGLEQRLKILFRQHNTFINASYIDSFVQSRLLELCQESAKYCDVFNIGSTHEYDGLGSVEYQNSKIDLRTKSLKFNTYRFKTHHIIVGGINKHQDPAVKDWLSIDEVCNIIPWIIEQRFSIPIICLDQPKQPW